MQLAPLVKLAPGLHAKPLASEGMDQQFGGGNTPTGEEKMRLTIALRSDHREVLDLLQRLIWELDREKWTQLVLQLARALDAHLTAEEHAIYKRLLQMKKTATLAKRSCAEHVQIRSAMRSLLVARPDTQQSIEGLATLRYGFTEHVAEEEEQLLPLLESVFVDESLDDIFLDYENRKMQVMSEWSSEKSFRQAATEETWQPPVTRSPESGRGLHGNASM